jgi:hypothetical protein
VGLRLGVALFVVVCAVAMIGGGWLAVDVARTDVMVVSFGETAKCGVFGGGSIETSMGEWVNGRSAMCADATEQSRRVVALSVAVVGLAAAVLVAIGRRRRSVAVDRARSAVLP